LQIFNVLSSTDQQWVIIRLKKKWKYRSALKTVISIQPFFAGIKKGVLTDWFFASDTGQGALSPIKNVIVRTGDILIRRIIGVCQNGSDYDRTKQDKSDNYQNPAQNSLSIFVLFHDFGIHFYGKYQTRYPHVLVRRSVFAE
jgi:hypothetical protein